MKKAIIIFCVVFITILLLWNVFNVGDIILKKIYPLKYTEYVEEYAKQNEIDKMLVYAIIKAESNFEPNITSNSGAMGLMQLMESTAKETANKSNIEFTTKEILYQPKTNIMLGTTYFAELLKQYYNNINLALAAYNAGIGNVTKWIKEGTIKEDGSNIENIPFKETNNYVRKILRDYKIYQELYRN